MARAKSPASRKRPPPSSRQAAAPAAFTGDESQLVVMGRLVGAFGIKGWLKVKPFTEQAASLGDFDRWLVRTPEGWRELALEEFELHSKGPVAKLAGCEDRAGAERLNGAEVAVPRTRLAEVEEGTLYRVDLVGLEVVDEQGRALGRVEGFFETGATAVMVVSGGKERMIPFVPDYVKAVDREGGRITVDWKADYDA